MISIFPIKKTGQRWSLIIFLLLICCCWSCSGGQDNMALIQNQLDDIEDILRDMDHRYKIKPQLDEIQASLEKLDTRLKEIEKKLPENGKTLQSVEKSKD